MKLIITRKLFFSFLIGFIFIWPHILTPALLGPQKNYTPLNIENVSTMTFDETHTYGSRIRRVFDGHLLVKDPLIYEYQNSLNQSTIFPPLVLGLLAKLFGSVGSVFILSDFIFPFLASLILLTLLEKINFINSLNYLTTSLVLLYGFRTDDWNQLLVSLFQTIKHQNSNSLITYFAGLTRQLEFSRLDSPEFTFAILLGALLFLYLSLKENKVRKYILFSGILFGLLFYSYAYYWIFFLFGGLTMLIICILRKLYKNASRILLSLVIGGTISLPYWWDYYHFKNLLQFNEISLRLGWEYGRTIIPKETFYILLLLLILIGIMFKIKSKNYIFNIVFLGSFLFGGLLCLNFRNIVGWGVQNWHFYIRIVYPWMVIVSISIFSSLFTISNKYFLLREKIIKFLCLVILLVALTTQTFTVINTHTSFTLSDDNTAAFTWLNEHTPEGSVIGSPSITVNYLIPTFTHNYVFLPDGLLSTASNKEIITRLLFLYSLYQIPEDYVQNLFTSQTTNNYIFKQKNGATTQELELLAREWYILHRTPVSDYPAFYTLKNQIWSAYKSGRVNPLRNNYKLDYLWLSNYEKIISAKLDNKKYQLVYYNNSISIYKYKKD